MEDEPLIHWGIPGMRWGHRRTSSGGITTVRGKVTPATISVRGKSVLVKPRPTSKGKLTFDKTNQVLKQAKRLKYKELVNSRNSRFNKIATGLGITLVASLGTLKYISLLRSKMPGLDSATDFSMFNSAYENWLRTG
jgi:hypothetical protein